jgi:hypothetical protein
MGELASWLRGLGLAKYQALLDENEIDLEVPLITPAMASSPVMHEMSPLTGRRSEEHPRPPAGGRGQRGRAAP